MPLTGKPMKDTHAYSLKEVKAMRKVLPEPIRTASPWRH